MPVFSNFWQVQHILLSVIISAGDTTMAAPKPTTKMLGPQKGKANANYNNTKVGSNRVNMEVPKEGGTAGQQYPGKTQ